MAIDRYTIYLLWILYNLVSCVSRSEKELFAHLFSDYQVGARPVTDPGTTLNITADLMPITIDDLDEKQQVLSMYAWFYMTWQDDYLRWNPQDWNGIKYIVVPSKNIWRPDVVIRNSATDVYGDVMNADKVFRVLVESSGMTHLSTSGSIKASCPIDMTYFPFDDQACYIHIDSWTYQADTCSLVNASVKINMELYRKNGQWDVLGTEVDRRFDILELGDQETRYSYIYYTFLLRRKPQYYVYNIILPSVMLSLLVMLVFLLPADSGEKISLGITVLLSFSVFQLLIADSMPKTSDYFPLIGIFILCTMMITGSSLLCTVGILAIHHHCPQRPIPHTLKTIICRMAKLCCVTSFLRHQQTSSVKPTEIGDVVRQDSERAWTTENEQTDLKPVEALTITELVDYVRYLKRAREGDDTEGKMKKQWVEVARIIDRMLFTAFLIITIIISVVLFGIYPLTKPAIPTVIKQGPN